MPVYLSGNHNLTFFTNALGHLKKKTFHNNNDGTVQIDSLSAILVRKQNVLIN